MTVYPLASAKSTIVRFLVLLAAGLTVAGCSAIGPRSATAVPCPPARTLICENFGPESRCNCTSAALLSRDIARFGGPVQMGGRGW